jgi:hypothetical protein
MDSGAAEFGKETIKKKQDIEDGRGEDGKRVDFWAKHEGY